VDINILIRHCFTLSQQQKVTSSKYLKDLGHAVVERTDRDDIIHTSTSEGIYDLTLGLSDNERRLLIALHGYDAAAITYGKTKEGAVEAHNFSAAFSLTSLHLAKGKGVKETPAPTSTLAQLVYSIGMSRVTNDSKEKSDEDKEDDNRSSNSKHIAIDRMDILQSNGKHGAMLLSTALMAETSKQASKNKNNMEKDSTEGVESKSTDEAKWQEEDKEESHLTAKMNKATALLHLSSDDEGSNVQGSNMSVRFDNLDLNLQDSASNAQEVSSGEFDAAYVKKYANPKSFLHALWNAAGPSAGAMRFFLEIIKDELEGQLAGVPAEFRNFPEQLINFMHKEAGEDPNEAIKFITHFSHKLSLFDNDKEEEDNESHVKAITYAEEAPAQGALGVGNKSTQGEASKTQGSPPGAQQTSPAEGAVNEPATEAGGDKEGVQSMSVAPGG
jgi:hypothetical protein